MMRCAKLQGNDLLLAFPFVEECSPRKIILPAITTIECLCANALVEAERLYATTIAADKAA